MLQLILVIFLASVLALPIGIVLALIEKGYSLRQAITSAIRILRTPIRSLKQIKNF